MSSLPINFLSFPLDFFNPLWLTPVRFLFPSSAISDCHLLWKMPFLFPAWLRLYIWTSPCLSVLPSPFFSALHCCQMLHLTSAEWGRDLPLLVSVAEGSYRTTESTIAGIRMFNLASWLKAIVSIPLSCHLPLLTLLPAPHVHMATPHLQPASESIYFSQGRCNLPPCSSRPGWDVFRGTT